MKSVCVTHEVGVHASPWLRGWSILGNIFSNGVDENFGRLNDGEWMLYFSYCHLVTESLPWHEKPWPSGLPLLTLGHASVDYPCLLVQLWKLSHSVMTSGFYGLVIHSFISFSHHSVCCSAVSSAEETGCQTCCYHSGCLFLVRH